MPDAHRCCRRFASSIRLELRRRSAIESVIGHMKNEGLLERNYLKGKDGDRINAIFAAAGQRQLSKWGVATLGVERQRANRDKQATAGGGKMRSATQMLINLLSRTNFFAEVK